MSWLMQRIRYSLLIGIGIMMTVQPLAQSPKIIEQFHEIAIQYSASLPEIYNTLSPQERIFIYYLFRAGLPGNRILTDQLHRYGLRIAHLFEHILDHEHELGEYDDVISQIKTFLVYLWTNHGQYFAREHSQEKRTPAKLGLDKLTPEALYAIGQRLSMDMEELRVLSPYIFDANIEPTSCVENSIEQSAVNIYAPDFTEQDYQRLSPAQRTYINAYYYVEHDENGRRPMVQRYKIGEKYSQELEVAQYWLNKAFAHAQNHPEYFDKHIVESLRLLIKFLQTGDEEDFKQHSIAWSKTKSRVDYVFGFIEVYQDPKGYRGMFQAEATIKSFDMNVLNALLPHLEKQLPFPEKFKRENLDDTSGIPNASVNVMAFGSGELGPLQTVAAYCLPNYEELRAQYGSKQIIYKAEKSLSSLLNPQLATQLSYHHKRAAWLEQNDPEKMLSADIWTAHCILHETLGHGSGRLDVHGMREGDPMTIAGVTYAVGDTVPVTSDNSNDFLGSAGSSLEELRAEIIALYTSVMMFDELAQAGLYKEWPKKIGKEALVEWLILDMARTGLRRLLTQPEGTVQITGAHAQANMTIMYYLLDHGAIRFVEEQMVVENRGHTVLDFDLVDREKALEIITQLAVLVQEIKSTADGQRLEQLLDQYGRTVRNPDHVIILKRNREAMVGSLKATAFIFPHFEPIRNSQGEIIDIQASWPNNIFEQHHWYRHIMLSKE